EKKEGEERGGRRLKMLSLLPLEGDEGREEGSDGSRRGGGGRLHTSSGPSTTNRPDIDRYSDTVGHLTIGSEWKEWE
ncbi:hypothetical protein PFISCL1PPCAC_24290, partial [Pristionchus fissidentatus]